MYKPPPAAGPDFHVVRVLHRHKDKTKNVDVLWHGRARPNPPTLGIIYLEPTPLDLDAHHITLGKFIDTWSKLEGALRQKIEQILGNGTPAAKTVAYANSGKALVDFLVNITEPILLPSRHREYVNLSERCHVQPPREIGSSMVTGRRKTSLNSKMIVLWLRAIRCESIRRRVRHNMLL